MSSDASENASNVAVESWDPLDTASPALHHLPFKISHTGHANVSKYLVCKEKTIPGHSEQTATISSSVTLSTTAKQTSFRGRYMKGTEVTLSEDYSGVIFREEEGDIQARIASLFESNGASKEGEEEENEEDERNMKNLRLWTLQNKFQKYTYWTRHSKPTMSDKHAKWLEWMTSIAPKIHASITAEDMAKPLKYTLLATKEEAKEVKSEESSEKEEVKNRTKRKEPEGEREDSEAAVKKTAEQEIK